MNGFQFWQRFELGDLNLLEGGGPVLNVSCLATRHWPALHQILFKVPIKAPDGPVVGLGRFPAAFPDQGATARGPDLTAESNKANSDLGNMENEGKGNSNTVEDIVEPVIIMAPPAAC